ncbi:hypothetical protein A45J_0995 [hot springs metagenome]|uniref:Uncharacterized protein n=1 Tax=hot springs metagenome TaxID=433727 RepID=A0A5J4L4V0_9ZZZZ
MVKTVSDTSLSSPVLIVSIVNRVSSISPHSQNLDYIFLYLIKQQIITAANSYPYIFMSVFLPI